MTPTMGETGQEPRGQTRTTRAARAGCASSLSTIAERAAAGFRCRAPAGTSPDAVTAYCRAAASASARASNASVPSREVRDVTRESIVLPLCACLRLDWKPGHSRARSPHASRCRDRPPRCLRATPVPGRRRHRRSAPPGCTAAWSRPRLASRCDARRSRLSPPDPPRCSAAVCSSPRAGTRRAPTPTAASSSPRCPRASTA